MIFSQGFGVFGCERKHGKKWPIRQNRTILIQGVSRLTLQFGILAFGMYFFS